MNKSGTMYKQDVRLYYLNAGIGDPWAGQRRESCCPEFLVNLE